MKPVVSIIMGSQSDFNYMKSATQALDKFKIAFEVKIVSAHRMPKVMQSFANQAQKRGIKVIIAGAGGAAHLPGMVASYTSLPVIGVPIKTETMEGIDSLLSIVQMPKGVPVASMAINGSYNAGLMAVRILALKQAKLNQKLIEFQEEQKKTSLQSNKKLQSQYK